LDPIQKGIRNHPAVRTRTGITDDAITVAYLDKIGRYRNHDAQKIMEVAELGTKVRVFESYGLLGVDVDHYRYRWFCIADADRPWTPWSTELSAMTPDALAERLSTRGGFSVPGGVVKDWAHD
jgi:hypothetical protein